MKIIEFLDPKKNFHIVRPEYLKHLYLSLNYHLLPKNIFLKKIIMFINLKILRKFRRIANFFKNSKFNLGEPSQHDIIVFDDENFYILSNIFSKQNYFILQTRIERIKKVYLSKKILLYMLRNFFKNSLKTNYLCSLIEIIHPKTIITFIDNSAEFSISAKIFKDRNIKFIAIQNAHRASDISFKNTNMHSLNYFTIGNHEIEIFKNKFQNISKMKSIGSLTAAVAKRYFEKNNIQLKENLYDICLVSEPFYHFNGDFGHIHIEQDYNVQDHVRLLTNHVLKFCKKYKKNFIISGKADVDSASEIKQAEVISYKHLVKNYNFDISFHKKSEFGNFKNIIQSRLIIGMCTTMLRESFEFKRKILWCNFIGHKYSNSPSEGICALRSKNFEDFENRVLEILKLDYEEYLSKIDNVDLFYNTKVNALKYLGNEINLSTSL